MKPKVTIYSTPLCYYCGIAKIYFGERGIEYTSIDVKEDVQARNEMMEKYDARGVPVIVVGSEFMIGWDEEKFVELYARMAQSVDAADSKSVS